MISINKQLKKYFVLVTFVSVLFVAVVSNLGMNLFFKDYIKKTRLRKDLNIIEYLENLYSEGQSLNDEDYRSIVSYAHSEGIVVKILNTKGQLILDTSKISMMGNGKGKGLGQGRGIGRNNIHEAEDFVYNDYPLSYSDKEIFEVKIGRPEYIYIATEDRNFIFTINGIYIGAFILSIIIAMFVSSYVSRKFLKPVITVRDNISNIAEGKYNSLKNINTNTVELSGLVDEVRELSVKLQYQESLRKRLTSDVSHELRTPLSTLQSYIEALMDGVWEPSKERLAAVHEEIMRLTKLIRDLSDLSNAESSSLNLSIHRFDISGLVNNTIDNFIPMFMEKHISIKRNISTSIMIQGDTDRLNQVLINILSNAFKHTQEYGEVKVKLTKENSFIKEDRPEQNNQPSQKKQPLLYLTVTDNGEGIPEGDLPFVFERFYRGDRSRSKKTGGSGIGLTISKAIVEAHQGEIKIESKKNHGTKVIITLPLNIQK